MTLVSVSDGGVYIGLDWMENSAPVVNYEIKQNSRDQGSSAYQDLQFQALNQSEAYLMPRSESGNMFRTWPQWDGKERKREKYMFQSTMSKQICRYAS
jgi:hypothetical protein